MEAVNRQGGERPPGQWEATLTAVRWLCPRTCEIELSRPAGFSFAAGQHIRLRVGTTERDYSLVTAPGHERLCLCVRQTAGSGLAAALAAMAPGERVAFAGPSGRFVFQPSARSAVFVATGTGIAPFVAMARSGLRGFILLHGVPAERELYYADELAMAASTYVGCISPRVVGEESGPAGGQNTARANSAFGPGTRQQFTGRVTAYLRTVLAPGAYDFYLCGGTGMIRDALHIIDARYPDCLAYHEGFY